MRLPRLNGRLSPVSRRPRPARARRCVRRPCAGSGRGKGPGSRRRGQRAAWSSRAVLVRNPSFQGQRAPGPVSAMPRATAGRPRPDNPGSIRPTPAVSFGQKPPPPVRIQPKPDEWKERVGLRCPPQNNLYGSTGMLHSTYAGSGAAGTFRVGFLFDWFTAKNFLCDPTRRSLPDELRRSPAARATRPIARAASAACSA